MAEGDGGENDDRLLRARLDKLSDALGKQGKASPPRRDARDGGGSSGKSGSEMSLGMRAASEFAAAIIVGSLIGWLLDRGLGTKPAFLIVFFMLGVAAGVWNVIRATSPSLRKGAATREQTTPPKAAEDAPSGADEDED